MSRRSDAARALLAAGARALLAACALAACGPVFALPSEQPAAGLRLQAPRTDGETLEALRAAAAFDDEARTVLARRLLDRFEAAGDKSDLREAVHWIARDGDQQAFLRRECARAVLRWYWVCGGGD